MIVEGGGEGMGYPTEKGEGRETKLDLYLVCCIKDPLFLSSLF